MDDETFPFRIGLLGDAEQLSSPAHAFDSLALSTLDHPLARPDYDNEVCAGKNEIHRDDSADHSAKPLLYNWPQLVSARGSRLPFTTVGFLSGY